MDNNTNDYGVMLMVIMPAPRTDSLYHYNAAQNRLEARFTVEYPNKEKIPWHGYSEYQCFLMTQRYRSNKRKY